jgi:uncharacterized protein (TIGR03083 family)
MEPLGRIDVLPLFGDLHSELIQLYRGFTPEQWNESTVCKGWAVRDIAAHLLDTDLRRLSLCRDRIEPPAPSFVINNDSDFVRYLNQLNADWVQVMRRVSPSVLVDLQAISGPQVIDYWKSLDPDGPAAFSVSWAGETVSANWFDCAREYTERWHHQEQIREAVGATRLASRRWLHPVLATFVRALPVTYRESEAPPGTTVTVEIGGEAGCEWTLLRQPGEWELFEGRPQSSTTVVGIDQDTAWRLFTKGIGPGEALKRSSIVGDESLGKPFFGALAVVAER